MCVCVGRCNQPKYIHIQLTAVFGGVGIDNLFLTRKLGQHSFILLSCGEESGVVLNHSYVSYFFLGDF